MAIVKGKDVNLYAYNDGLYNVIGCSRSCMLNTSSSLIEKTTKNSGKFQEFEHQKNSWTLSTDGLSLNQDDFTIEDLRQMQFNGTPVLMKMVSIDSLANEVTNYGYTLVTSIQETGSHQDAKMYAVEMQGTGALNTTTDIFDPSPNTDGVTTLEYTPTGGETTINSGVLNKDMLGIFIDGVLYVQVDSSPTGKQFTYDPVTGEIQVEIPLELGSDVVIWYQNL